MDKSSDVITDLSPSGQPVFSEQTVFLKSLIEGEGNLYQYEEHNFKRFFFSTKDKLFSIIPFRAIKTNFYLRRLRRRKKIFWSEKLFF
jgi:hypothetical protein